MISFCGFRLIVFGLITSFAILAQPHADVRVFTSGSRTTFSSVGHPKAQGLNLRMSFPKTWAAKEGERPHVLQKFVSENGHGLEMAILVVKPIPLPGNTKISEAEIKEVLSDARSLIPPDANFISARQSKIEGLPAALIEVFVESDGVAGSIIQRTWSVVFIAERNFVSILFSVAVGSDPARPNDARLAVDQKMASVRPLFMMMANSLVLPDRYR